MNFAKKSVITFSAHVHVINHFGINYVTIGITILGEMVNLQKVN